MGKVEWLDRQLTKCAYCYTLCLTEEDYFAELDKLGVKQGDRHPFSKTAWASATVNFYEPPICKNSDDPVALVCMRGFEEHAPITVAGLLVHEAVHIWQAHARNIGSLNDHGDEEEAYAIQRIAQELMWSFIDQTSNNQGERNDNHARGQSEETHQGNSEGPQHLVLHATEHGHGK